MSDIHFKTFHTQDFNSEEIFKYNKKILTLNLNKIVFSNPNKSLKSLFPDDTTLCIMNEYIFELLGCGLIQYYKAGTKLTERCLYDDKPDGYTKLVNRKYIQDIIQENLLKDCDYMDDFMNELITTHLEIEGWKFKGEDGATFNSKEELDDYIENLSDGVDEYLAKQEIDDELDEYITNVDDYIPVDELPSPPSEWIEEKNCKKN